MTHRLDEAEAQVRRRADDLGPLFASAPLARPTDPVTSHAAIPSAERRAHQHGQILAALAQLGPSCADAIDAHLEAQDRSWLRTAAGRRLHEMEALGHVQRVAGRTQVTRTGKHAEVWAVVAERRAAA